MRGIPAAESERWALNGLDPTHLAMLALKDAQRGIAAAPQDGGFYCRKVAFRAARCEVIFVLPLVCRQQQHGAAARVHDEASLSAR